jgi:hypothetical protein
MAAFHIRVREGIRPLPAGREETGIETGTVHGGTPSRRGGKLAPMTEKKQRQ